MFLEVSQNSQENTYARVSVLIKLQACNFIKKEALVRILLYEFCEIFKNTFFIEHLRTIASVATKECEGFTNLIQISPEVTSQSYSYCKNLFLLRCCDG